MGKNYTDLTNFPDGESYICFPLVVFYDKFTILPNLELIGTASMGPINPKSVQPFEKAVSDGHVCIFSILVKAGLG